MTVNPLAISVLPESSPVMDDMLTEEPLTGAYGDVASVRLRRFKERIDCEAPNQSGGWFHWYVFTGPQAYGVVSLGRLMAVPRALALRAPRSEAAALVESMAPTVAALARQVAVRVDGVQTIALHVPVRATPDPEGIAVGLRPEETMSSTLLLVPFPEPLGAVVDGAWLERSTYVLSGGMPVLNECLGLAQAFFTLDPAVRRRVLSARSGDWKGALSTGAEVVSDVAKIVDGLATIMKPFAP